MYKCHQVLVLPIKGYEPEKIVSIFEKRNYEKGEGVTREDLSMEEFIMGVENFHEGGAGFSSII